MREISESDIRGRLRKRTRFKDLNFTPANSVKIIKRSRRKMASQGKRKKKYNILIIKSEEIWKRRGR